MAKRALSREAAKPFTSSEAEVDELATSPARGIPDVGDSSDEEQDPPIRRRVQQRRPLTADEQVLARIVRAGVDAEQLKLIKGVRIVLPNHKGKPLASQHNDCL